MTHDIWKRINYNLVLFFNLIHIGQVFLGELRVWTSELKHSFLLIPSDIWLAIPSKGNDIVIFFLKSHTLKMILVWSRNTIVGGAGKTDEWWERNYIPFRSIFYLSNCPFKILIVLFNHHYQCLFNFNPFWFKYLFFYKVSIKDFLIYRLQGHNTLYYKVEGKRINLYFY